MAQRNNKSGAVDADALRESLLDSSSAKRRSAAKKLRKLRDSRSCGALLSALSAEILDQRTWETQVEIIVALGNCGCQNALPILYELSEQNFCATARLSAIGYAIVRLDRSFPADRSPIFAMLDVAKRNDPLIAEGAVKAAALLRLKFGSTTEELLLEKIKGLDSRPVYFWTAIACAGWTSSSVKPFLNKCLLSPDDFIRKAAALALDGKYSV